MIKALTDTRLKWNILKKGHKGQGSDTVKLQVLICLLVLGSVHWGNCCVWVNKANVFIWIWVNVSQYYQYLFFSLNSRCLSKQSIQLRNHNAYQCVHLSSTIHSFFHSTIDFTTWISLCWLTMCVWKPFAPSGLLVVFFCQSVYRDVTQKADLVPMEYSNYNGQEGSPDFTEPRL